METYISIVALFLTGLGVLAAYSIYRKNKKDSNISADKTAQRELLHARIDAVEKYISKFRDARRLCITELERLQVLVGRAYISEIGFARFVATISDVLNLHEEAMEHFKDEQDKRVLQRADELSELGSEIVELIDKLKNVLYQKGTCACGGFQDSLLSQSQFLEIKKVVEDTNRFFKDNLVFLRWQQTRIIETLRK